MRKIANTTELTSELQRLLDYAGSHQPSRVKLASRLQALSYRVAGSASPNIDKIIDKDIGSKIKTLSERINRAAEKAESKGESDRQFEIAVKATYELIHLFDPFKKGIENGEAKGLEGTAKIDPTIKSISATLKNLDEQYRAAQGDDRNTGVLTKMGTEAATLSNLYSQFRRDIHA